jgi:hypothetical protein
MATRKTSRKGGKPQQAQTQAETSPATQAAQARLVKALNILKEALASPGGQLPWPINRTPSFPPDFDWATVPEGFQWPGVDWSKHPEALAVENACRTVREALQNGKPDFDETIAPRALLSEIAQFVSQDVGEDLDSLPARPSIRRKLDTMMQDLGGEENDPTRMLLLTKAQGVFGFQTAKELTCFLDRHPEVRQGQPRKKDGTPHKRKRLVDALGLSKAISRDDAIMSDPRRRARMQSRIQRAQFSKGLEAEALAYILGGAE